MSMPNSIKLQSPSSSYASLASQSKTPLLPNHSSSLQHYAQLPPLNERIQNAAQTLHALADYAKEQNLPSRKLNNLAKKAEAVLVGLAAKSGSQLPEDDSAPSLVKARKLKEILQLSCQKLLGLKIKLDEKEEVLSHLVSLNPTTETSLACKRNVLEAMSANIQSLLTEIGENREKVASKISKYAVAASLSDTQMLELAATSANGVEPKWMASMQKKKQAHQALIDIDKSLAAYTAEIPLIYKSAKLLLAQIQQFSSFDAWKGLRIEIEKNLRFVNENFEALKKLSDDSQPIADLANATLDLIVLTREEIKNHADLLQPKIKELKQVIVLEEGMQAEKLPEICLSVNAHIQSQMESYQAVVDGFELTDKQLQIVGTQVGLQMEVASLHALRIKLEAENEKINQLYGEHQEAYQKAKAEASLLNLEALRQFHHDWVKKFKFLEEDLYIEVHESLHSMRRKKENEDISYTSQLILKFNTLYAASIKALNVSILKKLEIDAANELESHALSLEPQLHYAKAFYQNMADTLRTLRKKANSAEAEYIAALTNSKRAFDQAAAIVAPAIANQEAYAKHVETLKEVQALGQSALELPTNLGLICDEEADKREVKAEYLRVQTQMCTQRAALLTSLSDHSVEEASKSCALAMEELNRCNYALKHYAGQYAGQFEKAFGTKAIFQTMEAAKQYSIVSRAIPQLDFARFTPENPELRSPFS